MKIRSGLMAVVAALGVVGTVTLTTPAHADEQTVTFEIRDRGDELSLNDIKQLVEKRVKTDIGTPVRAIVAGDKSGTPLPADVLRILYSGKDAGDVKLLATFDRPASGSTLAELKKAGGGSVTESVVDSRWEASGSTSGGPIAQRARQSGVEIVTICQQGFGCVRIVSWTPGSILV